jgi:hypothetical protein
LLQRLENQPIAICFVLSFALSRDQFQADGQLGSDLHIGRCLGALIDDTNLVARLAADFDRILQSFDLELDRGQALDENLALCFIR